MKQLGTINEIAAASQVHPSLALLWLRDNIQVKWRIVDSDLLASSGFAISVHYQEIAP